MSLPGFEDDATGQCVATPYSVAPRNARLLVSQIQEVLGLIFACWGAKGREPQWRLRADSLVEAGWSRMEIKTTRCLETHFDFRRTRRITPIATLTFDFSATTDILGLGYSFVEILEHSVGMDMRMLVLATPVDGTLIDLSLVSQTRELRNPRRWIAGLGFLPLRPRAPIMNKIIVLMQDRDVRQDVVVWSHKRYRPRPQFCFSEGGIMPYRAYYAHFYPGPRNSESLGNDA